MGKRKMEDYMGDATLDDLECAQNLLFLKYSCDDSRCEQNNNNNNNNNPRIIEKGECSRSSSNEKKQPRISFKLKIIPPKAAAVSPPIERILERFGERDAAYGVKRVATGACLTETDTKPHQARLSMARSKLDRELEERTFLTETEANTIAGPKGRISVKVRGSFSDKEYDMAFAKWFYASKRGFGYVWMSGWNQFRVDNGLQIDDPVTIDAIRRRHDGVLCFAIHGGRRS